MSEVIIQFYSDTNHAAAFDELELLQLDTIHKSDSTITISAAEYDDMEEPIRSIVEAWGGQFYY